MLWFVAARWPSVARIRGLTRLGLMRLPAESRVTVGRLQQVGCRLAAVLVRSGGNSATSGASGIRGELAVGGAGTFGGTAPTGAKSSATGGATAATKCVISSVQR